VLRGGEVAAVPGSGGSAEREAAARVRVAARAWMVGYGGGQGLLIGRRPTLACAPEFWKAGGVFAGDHGRRLRGGERTDARARAVGGRGGA